MTLLDLEAEKQRAYEIEKARQLAIADAEASRIWRERDFFPQKVIETQSLSQVFRAERREERRLQRLETDKNRRALVAACRDAAHRFTVEAPDLSFREFLEGERVYPDIRSHLSADYLAKINAGRTTYSSADGARYESLVGWFLDEIDRLERDWRLV